MFNESAQKLTYYVGKEDDVRSSGNVPVNIMNDIQYQQYSVNDEHKPASELDLDHMVKSPTGISNRRDQVEDVESKKFRRSVFSKENISNKKKDLSSNHLLMTGEEIKDLESPSNNLLQGSQISYRSSQNITPMRMCPAPTESKLVLKQIG